MSETYYTCTAIYNWWIFNETTTHLFYTHARTRSTFVVRENINTFKVFIISWGIVMIVHFHPIINRHDSPNQHPTKKKYKSHLLPNLRRLFFFLMFSIMCFYFNYENLRIICVRLKKKRKGEEKSSISSLCFKQCKWLIFVLYITKKQ